MVRKYFLLIFALITGSALFSLGYVYYLLEDLSPKLVVFNKSLFVGEKTMNVLEEGSLIKLRELKNYLLFSKYEGGLKEWIEEHKNFMGKEALNKGLSYISRDINLAALLENDCSLSFCYQHRIPFGDIPSIFWKGLIGIEDGRFIFHKGVDLKSIARALWTDIKAGKLVQGGSTITQQLVKNLYFSNEKTITRKIKELVIAIYLERHFSKEKILEAYFNEFVWGALQGTKVKGLFSASLFYFGKKVDKLGPYEAAILIALLKGPHYYHPLRRTRRLMKRANFVFEKLKRLGLYPRGANSRPWGGRRWKNWTLELRQREQNQAFKSLEWTTSLRNQENIFQDYEKFYFNKKAQDLRKQILKKFKSPKDISIKAIIGRPFSRKEKNLFYYYSKRERSLKKAIELEQHQVGSLFKPILYRIFLENGYDLKDTVSLEEITLNLKSGLWSPRESHKNLPSEATIGESLAKSFNRPVIRIASQIGFDKLEVEVGKFIPGLKRPLREYPAQLLGSKALSLREVYNVYKGFITKDCFSKNFLEEGQVDRVPSIINYLSNPLLGTVRKAVGPFLKNMRYFGKTGTSNNGHDNWYIFFTGKDLGVIWVGLEGKREGKDLNLYGSTTSFRLFQRFYRERGKSFSALNCH